MRRREPVIPPIGDDPLGRVAATKRLLHIADIRTEPHYIDKHPPLVALADVAGARTLLIVPMLKDDPEVAVLAAKMAEPAEAGARARQARRCGLMLQSLPDDHILQSSFRC